MKNTGTALGLYRWLCFPCTSLAWSHTKEENREVVCNLWKHWIDHPSYCWASGPHSPGQHFQQLGTSWLAAAEIGGYCSFTVGCVSYSVHRIACAWKLGWWLELAQTGELTPVVVGILKPQMRLVIRVAGAEGWTQLTELEETVSLVCS